MQIKVCGMKDPGNIRELIQLPINWLGLIFYEQSPRYAGELNVDELKIVPSSIQKTGVFVNASAKNISEHVRRFDLQAVQLHGEESPALCRELKSQGVQVIKTFSIENPEDLKSCVFYEDACDYYLFDTKTLQYGGSGKKFDWQTLSFYQGKTPFFLSGGIDLEDAETIQQLDFPQFYAVDLNSRFEILPGIKNIGKIQQFINLSSHHSS
jgi:phosphoribosylanthranilate isomerase